ncbi:hypothetical protein Afil01_02870 [Actinorhabdospora filicis]|uniref:Lysoplasmalogenase n=1 Tax=Actinorhabdospora filicis TaxID=1785913 RepID=A0A9W6SGA7_9ACTN|nr:lysoplasmalogenase [Actinorhabdospora filicis]GLZ75480.1 hypothetical protein Afil01_02870 [Actinorhabdospora filicis]
MKRALPLALLAALALVHLAALGAGWDTAATATKPLLMPLLAWFTAIAARPPLRTPLIAAVLFGWAGDVLLQLPAEAAFLGGMGAFALGHLRYEVTAIRHGSWRTRKVAIAACAYAVVWAAVLVALWPGLPGPLRAPVAVYSLLLTATAVLTVGVNVRAAAGGALFLISDTLIATGIAHTWRPPAVDVWIMATYVAAQYLLVTGFLAHTPSHKKEPLAVA